MNPTEEGDGEANYEASEDHVLHTWKEMVAAGELTDEQLRELAAGKDFALVCNEIELDGMDDMRELLKTPKQLRIEKGIDEGLTTQVRDNLDNTRRVKEKHTRRRQLRYKMRDASKAEIQKMSAEGIHG